MTSRREKEKAQEKTAPMDPRKQATLMNYHQAIEDSVDLDRLWPEMDDVFTQREKMAINKLKGKERTRAFVEGVASKDDAVFDRLVKGLRRDYRWLASRLTQGVKDEDMRLKLAGEGVRQKVALALLTTRISERQKESIITNVSDVIETELHDKALRVSVPDHRAGTDLDHLNSRLKHVINDELDPLLYGPGHRTNLGYQEADEVVSKLQGMLTELNVLQDCYSALGVHAYSASGKALPNILCEKINETRTSIDILQKEKKELLKEKADIAKEKNLQGKDVSQLESRNRSLELHNRTLEAECGKLDVSVKKFVSAKDSLEIDKRKLQDENMKLVSVTQGLQTENWNLGLKNRRMEEFNTKLTRENQKLVSKNTLMKKGGSGSSSSISSMKADNKNLVEQKAKLKAEAGKLEAEKRQLLIRNQKLESENENLRDQKRKLMVDKRKYFGENQQLKTEAKRLALGKYDQPVLLPPINEIRGSKASVKNPGQGQPPGGSNQNPPRPPGKGARGVDHSLNRGRGADHSPTRGGIVTVPNRKSINSSTFTGPMPGSKKPTGSSQQSSTYRASVYDYRPKNTGKSVQFSSSPPQPRYGNKA